MRGCASRACFGCRGDRRDGQRKTITVEPGRPGWTGATLGLYAVFNELGLNRLRFQYRSNNGADRLLIDQTTPSLLSPRRMFGERRRCRGRAGAKSPRGRCLGWAEKAESWDADCIASCSAPSTAVIPWVSTPPSENSTRVRLKSDAHPRWGRVGCLGLPCRGQGHYRPRVSGASCAIRQSADRLYRRSRHRSGTCVAGGSGGLRRPAIRAPSSLACAGR